jgi:hypothetical protein
MKIAEITSLARKLELHAQPCSSLDLRVLFIYEPLATTKLFSTR